MSCQQVPRLTEDPYTFTETTPVTATLFNPQIHKLSPIISAPVTNQKQILTQRPQIITQQRAIQQQHQHQPPQIQQVQTSRINGITALVNGVHKNLVTTTHTILGKKIQQPQLQYQPAKITTTPTSKKFLPPPSPATVTIHQSHPLYSIAKQNPVINTSPLSSSNTPVPLPPLFQRSSITTSSPIVQQQTAETSLVQKNHSTLKKPVFGINHLQTLPQTNFSNYGLLTTTSTATTTSQQNHSPLLPITTGKKLPFPSPKSINSTVVTTTAIGGDLKTCSESPIRKRADSDQSVFVTPAKRDSRTLSTASKKSGKVQNLPNIRTKRSYSQTAHHEALQRIPSSNSINVTAVSEWHAPDSYIFDNVSPASTFAILGNFENYDVRPSVQSQWLNISDIVASIPTTTPITREQRIELRKAQLRRQALQNISAQKFRNSQNARRRLIGVSKALQKLKEKEEAPAQKKCCSPACNNDALALTAYCNLHITRNADQHLFLPCTAKFSDNSQCRVPVFDISHELPLCREHAWKRDNYNRIVQEQKPKKPPRKRPKPSAMTRPQKRNKKKRKQQQNSLSPIVKTSPTTMVTKMGYQIKPDDVNYIITQTSIPTIAAYANTSQDMLGICENSSAYESSEDTGVGGLSETELMVGSHDVIEEIPLGDTRLLEEHDLTNVLNQLPVDAFNELFTTVQQNGPLEPTQEEQEDLERALEAVNKQVKSLQQMTGGDDSNFLGDFLDVDDQMLEDSDICAEVVLHSPDTEGIDANSVILSGGESSNGGICTTNTSSDIRGLVQT